MKEYICDYCGGCSYSAADLEKLRDDSCPYCGKRPKEYLASENTKALHRTIENVTFDLLKIQRWKNANESKR